MTGLLFDEPGNDNPQHGLLTTGASPLGQASTTRRARYIENVDGIALATASQLRE
jgi:hypothetical protein